MPAQTIIDCENAAIVHDAMPPKRAAKFRARLDMIIVALEAGAWPPHTARKARGIVYDGCPGWRHKGALRHSNHHLDMCLCYGHPYDPEKVTAADLSRAISALKLPSRVHADPAHVLGAWITLCTEVYAAIKLLDEARPKPVVTKIGLSPKVTTTLTAMGLDIDITTIVPAEIVPVKVHARNDAPPFEQLFNNDGTPRLMTIWVVKWRESVKLGLSRFAHNDCEACGKTIPSRRFVPIEAQCRKNGLIGLWVGCDCARNIFGVKDAGIAKS